MKIEVRFDPSRQPVVVQGFLVLVGALFQAFNRLRLPLLVAGEGPHRATWSEWRDRRSAFWGT